MTDQETSTLTYTPISFEIYSVRGVITRFRSDIHNFSIGIHFEIRMEP